MESTSTLALYSNETSESSESNESHESSQLNETNELPDYSFSSSNTFDEILKIGNKYHITWLLMNSLMHNIIKQFDAVIFGGAVRDLLLHNYNARQFYKLYTNEIRFLFCETLELSQQPQLLQQEKRQKNT